MHHRLFKTYGNAYWESLNDQFLAEGSTDVFLVNDEFSDESDWNLVFSSPEALKKVSLRDFVADVKELLADSKEYLARIDHEKIKVEQWVVRELEAVRAELRLDSEEAV